MPFVLALMASALIHAAALIGPGWTLPGLDADPAPAIEAVLVRPAPRLEAPARPAPHKSSADKAPAEKPRPHPAAAPVLAAVGADSPAPGPLPATSPVAAPAPAVAPAVAEPVAVAPVATALPGKGRVRYTITRGEGGFVVGQSVHTWQHDGDRYTIQSVTETTGLAALFKPVRVVQSSAGDLTAAGLRPHEFRHERVGGLDTAVFDWTRGVVAYAGREDSLAAGTQDMLSMYYELVLLAPRSGSLDLPIATGRKLETYHLEILGEEVVAMPGGERRALHLKTRSGNDSLDVWIAADMRALPLKIRFTDRKGEIFDQLATDIDIQETQ